MVVTSSHQRSSDSGWANPLREFLPWCSFPVHTTWPAGSFQFPTSQSRIEQYIIRDLMLNPFIYFTRVGLTLVQAMALMLGWFRKILRWQDSFPIRWIFVLFDRRVILIWPCWWIIIWWVWLTWGWNCLEVRAVILRVEFIRGRFVIY